MVKVISIVGKTDSGKTTLIEKLIIELKKKGIKVGTIKHDVHGFDIDREGKDSWRHFQAGADAVVISSPKKIALIKRIESEYSLDEIAEEYFEDMDILITEGYKRDNKPKIEVYRSNLYPEPLCKKDDNLIAIASDKRIDSSVPCFDINDASSIADFIQEKFILSQEEKPSVKVWINGKKLGVKEFVQDFIKGAVSGMLSALRGTQGAKKIRIDIDI